MTAFIVIWTEFFSLCFGLIVELKLFLLNYLVSLKHDAPFVLTTLELLKDSFVVFLRCFYWLLTLRFSLMWFPNVNPYIQPFIFLRLATEPLLVWFEGFLPTIFGVDLSLLTCSLTLEWVTRVLADFSFLDL